MKHEYHEVPKAREKLQKLARAVSRPPRVDGCQETDLSLNAAKKNEP